MIKRIVISLIVILLIFVVVIILKDGITVFGQNVYSVPKIQDTSKELDNKIQKSTELNKVTFKSKEDELNSSIQGLIAEKERYRLVLDQSSKEERNKASQIHKYEMEFLWTKIGNYASKNKVILIMDVTSGLSSDTKNLNFTVNGTYSGITDFLYSIENDSKLPFRIEDFKLEKETTNENLTGTLKGTFTVRNITINI